MNTQQVQKLDENEYREIKYSDGTILQTGPAGGWCFMIPRNVYNTVGKFRQIKNKVFSEKTEIIL